MGFSFSVKAWDSHSRARAGVLKVAQGKVKTPVFMPVGTSGSVKSLSPEDLSNSGAQIILSNTYHLYLRPGEGVVSKLGGLHEFMQWKKPILTDSGGYQVSSLGYFLEESARSSRRIPRSKIDDDGVTFFSHIDGSKQRLTPEKSIEIQEKLGADIIMAFDEATPNKGKSYAKLAMQRTHKWLERSIKKWRELESEKSKEEYFQVLFGIIQGGNYKKLRRQSAKFVVEQDLPGVAVGGGSIGQNSLETERNISWIRDIIPKDKPLYLMGVGVSPSELVAAVLSGADMFDCVAPTRLGRMGHLYSGKLKRTSKGFKFVSEFEKERINIANLRFKDDRKIIYENCDCYCCERGFSRGYLHHLFKSRELLYYRLASIHNTRFMIRLTEEMREHILKLESG